MLKMKLIASLMLIVLTTALIGGLTGAWFTDADTAGTATFTAGTLDIDVSDGLSTFQLLLPLESKHGNMNPGDVYDEITIDIENTGTKNLAWFGNWVFTPETPGADKLLDKMYIKSMGMYFLKADDTAWNADPWYQGYNFIEDGKGNLLAHNAGEDAFFDGLAALSPDNVITLRTWNDNSNMIPGTIYEHMGALKPLTGNKYVLKVVIGFHESADNSYQGNAPLVSPITVGFNVDATQVSEGAVNALNPGMGTTHINWLNTQLTMQP